MIKNVIFDFGQVLISFLPSYMVGVHVSDKEDAKLLADVVFDRLYWDKMDVGALSSEEMIEMVKQRLPKRLWGTAEKVYYDWIYNIPEIEGMRENVVYLKEKGIGVYLLSNISDHFVNNAHKIPILNLIENRIFSSVCHMVKPDVKIFEYALEKFSLNPSETLFVDDREDNVESARRVGMTGYVFDGNAQALREFFDREIFAE